jgi:tRNA (guanine37-N1)-methyltransferase
MHFQIVSALPELLAGPFDHSILKRAQSQGIIEVTIHHLRKYGIGKHKQIDDYAYGGGAGMVMMPEPLARCLDHIKSISRPDEIIYLTPDGLRHDQRLANKLSLKKNLVLICGHYKGIDERIRQEYVTLEISIGDYVLSGGELAAAVVLDSVARLIPGVISDETSALSDSFQDDLLAPPVYTRPADFRGKKVPDVLISGHQAMIDEWRMQQALERTRERRPDLLER